jgi:hypothetical protein
VLRDVADVRGKRNLKRRCWPGTSAAGHCHECNQSDHRPSVHRPRGAKGGWVGGGGGGVGGGGGAEEGQVVGLVGRRPVSRRRKRASSCLHQPVVLRVANKAAAAVLLPVSRVVCTDNGAPWLVDAPRAGAQAAAAAGTAAVHSCNGALPRISTDGRLGAAAGRWLQERERERRAAVYFSCPHNVQRRRRRRRRRWRRRRRRRWAAAGERYGAHGEAERAPEQQVTTSALCERGSGAPRRRALRGPCLSSNPPGQKKSQASPQVFAIFSNSDPTGNTKSIA